MKIRVRWRTHSGGTAQGSAPKAAATLARAHRIAPWYGRVPIVQAGIGAGITSGVELPAVDTADESRLLEDPWATPEV